MFLAWKGNVRSDVVEQKVGHTMHSSHHAIDNEQIPPRSAPALLHHRHSTTIHNGKAFRWKPKLDGNGFDVSQDVARLFLLAVSVQGHDKEDHGLHDKSIRRGFRSINSLVRSVVQRLSNRSCLWKK